MRNRITYGQSAVFCSQSPAHSDNTNNVSGLRRIQNVNVDFSFNRERFKQIGSENFIGNVHLKNAEIKAGISYYYSNGMNEALIGLNVNGSNGYITKYIKKQNQDKNFYILFGSGENNNIYDETSIVNNYDICALGNCFLEAYSLSAQVGSPVSCEASFSAYNAKMELYDDINGKFIPAINVESGIPSEHYKYVLSTEKYLNLGNLEEETDIALSPSEITFEFPVNVNEPGIKFSGQQSAPLTSFNLGFQVDRKDLYGFGSMYPYGRRALFPILCSLDFSATIQEFQFGNLHDIIMSAENEYDFTFNFKNCNGATGLQLQIEKSLIDKESISQSIGKDGEVNVSMTFPISNTTGLRMNTPPLLLSHPVSSDATGPSLSVSVTGKSPFIYEWYDAENELQNEQTSVFSPVSAGNYYCVVYNDLGSGISKIASYAI